MGADPTSSAWRADVLADKLYLHIRDTRRISCPNPTSEEQYPWLPKTFTEIPERSNLNQTNVNLLNRALDGAD